MTISLKLFCKKRQMWHRFYFLKVTRLLINHLLHIQLILPRLHMMITINITANTRKVIHKVTTRAIMIKVIRNRLIRATHGTGVVWGSQILGCRKIWLAITASKKVIIISTNFWKRYRKNWEKNCTKNCATNWGEKKFIQKTHRGKRKLCEKL